MTVSKILTILFFGVAIINGALAQQLSVGKSALPGSRPGAVGYGNMPGGQTATSGMTAAYLASVIPTPGLTDSSSSGTSGVRNASDSSLTARPGSGEGLNQSRPATTTGTQFHIQDDFPNLLPLPFAPTYVSAALASYDITCTPGVFYYETAHDAGTVYKIGTCPLTVLKTLNVCQLPLQLQHTPDGSTEVVACYDNTIALINTSTDSFTTISTPLYNPNGVDVSPDGTTAYFSSYLANPAVIFSVNLQTGQINPQTVTVDAYPKNIFLTPDGSQLWVDFYQGSDIYIIDTLSMTVSATLSGPGGVQDGIAFTPDGTRAYVSIAGGSVSVYDTATLKQVASIPVSGQPTGVVATKDGGRIFVSNWAQNNPMFSIIDVTSNTLVTTILQVGPALGFTIFH
jgi:YVTN family beta-propeller protein